MHKILTKIFHLSLTNIVVYRDGISEGQFTECLDKELTEIKNAIDLVGGVDVNTGDSIKVTFIVCTKRHNYVWFMKTVRVNTVTFALVLLLMLQVRIVRSYREF